MESTASQPSEAPSVAGPSIRLTLRFRIGITLALAGFLVTQYQEMLNVYVSTFIAPGRVVFLYLPIQAVLAAVGLLLIGLGLFLVVRDLEAVLAGTRPWTLIGSLLILSGGVASAIAYLSGFMLPGSGYGLLTFGMSTSIAIQDTIWIAIPVLGIGGILSVVGVARGIRLKIETSETSATS